MIFTACLVLPRTIALSDAANLHSARGLAIPDLPARRRPWLHVLAGPDRANGVGERRSITHLLGQELTPPVEQQLEALPLAIEGM
jgi:hypothetical protein